LLDHKFFADFVLLNTVILEIKSKKEICDEDLAQTINYLKCSGCKVGLVLNFEERRLKLNELFFKPFTILCYSVFLWQLFLFVR